jgi:hypothetical protein
MLAPQRDQTIKGARPVGKSTRSGGEIEKICAAVAAIVGALAAAPTLFAQSPESVNVDVAQCIRLESPEARFACYEARVEEEVREQRPGAANAPEPQTAREPQSSREPRSAREPERAPEPEIASPPRRVDAREADVRSDDTVEIFGTIASLRETVPNSYLITLEDGQVWRQMRPKWYPMRPGQKVRIYPGRWGPSFRLSAEELKNFIQVERVR